MDRNRFFSEREKCGNRKKSEIDMAGKSAFFLDAFSVLKNENRKKRGLYEKVCEKRCLWQGKVAESKRMAEKFSDAATGFADGANAGARELSREEAANVNGGAGAVSDIDEAKKALERGIKKAKFVNEFYNQTGSLPTEEQMEKFMDIAFAEVRYTGNPIAFAEASKKKSIDYYVKRILNPDMPLQVVLPGSGYAGGSSGPIPVTGPAHITSGTCSGTSAYASGCVSSCPSNYASPYSVFSSGINLEKGFIA